GRRPSTSTFAVAPVAAAEVAASPVARASGRRRTSWALRSPSLAPLAVTSNPSAERQLTLPASPQVSPRATLSRATRTSSSTAGTASDTFGSQRELEQVGLDDRSFRVVGHQERLDLERTEPGLDPAVPGAQRDARLSPVPGRLPRPYDRRCAVLGPLQDGEDDGGRLHGGERGGGRQRTVVEGGVDGERPLVELGRPADGAGLGPAAAVRQQRVAEALQAVVRVVVDGL